MTRLIAVVCLLGSCLSPGLAEPVDCAAGSAECQGQDYQVMLQARVETRNGNAALAEDSSEYALQKKAGLLQVEREDHFHGLIFAMPLVMSNLSMFYGDSVTGPRHKFGDVEADKLYLLEKMDGFLNLMQEILGDEGRACPLDSESVSTANDCLKLAMCLVQSKVKTTEEMKKYTLFEELYTRFEDIGWPQLAEKLNIERGSKKPDAYMTPAEHSCDGAGPWHEGITDAFLQMDSNDTSSAASKKAAAYRTSSALVALADRKSVV